MLSIPPTDELVNRGGPGLLLTFGSYLLYANYVKRKGTNLKTTIYLFNSILYIKRSYYILFIKLQLKASLSEQEILFV